MSAYNTIIAIVGGKLKEEAPVNVVGGGNVAGVGVGPQGEPPGLPALLKKLRMMKRKPPVSASK